MICLYTAMSFETVQERAVGLTLPIIYEAFTENEGDFECY